MRQWTDWTGRVWIRFAGSDYVVTMTAIGNRRFRADDVALKVAAMTNDRWAPVAWCRFANQARAALVALS